MLVGLADDAATEVATAEMLANMFGANIPATQTITLPPINLTAPAPRAATVPGAGVLDKVLPKKIVNGKVTIWGLPPAVAYTLVAVILAGGGLVAYKHFSRGRVGNPRRRNSTKRRARYKR